MNDLQKAQANALVAKFKQIEAVPRRTTLSRVHESPEVRALGNRDDGSLSENQQHLVATVVAFVQDDIIAELQGQRQVFIEELEAQRNAFVELTRATAVSVFQFARQGMFTSPKEDETDTRPLWRRIFTWGNFVSGSAVVLVAIAGFTTHTYLAYKERAEITSSALASLQVNYEKQSASLTAAQDKVQKLSGDLIEREKTLVEKQAAITVLNSQLEVKEVKEESELQKQLNDALLKASQAQADADKGRPEIKRLRDQVATLSQIRKDLEDERDSLRAENHEKAEAIDSLTKKLAKEKTSP